MIREVQPFDMGDVRAPFTPGPIAAQAQPEAAPSNPESAEQEIARLTWSVLDGSASLGDRQRLAVLVNAQHAVRRRIDR